jgi:hypothetical protein
LLPPRTSTKVAFVVTLLLNFIASAKGVTPRASAQPIQNELHENEKFPIGNAELSASAIQKMKESPKAANAFGRPGALPLEFTQQVPVNAPFRLLGATPSR